MRAKPIVAILCCIAFCLGSCGNPVVMYSIVYDGNGNIGGAVPSDGNVYAVGIKTTVLGNEGNLSKTGYVFDGWNTKPDGSGADRAIGTSFVMPAENVVLYAQWRPLAVGDAGPAGGLIFYDKGINTEGWRYLEAAPADIGTELYGRPAGDATSAEVGAGETNTYYLLSVPGMRAAVQCWSFSLNGYDDWFLPSTGELLLMLERLHMNDLGAFQNALYWSSTQPADDLPNCLNFKSGIVVSGMGRTGYIRQARAF